MDFGLLFWIWICCLFQNEISDCLSFQILSIFSRLLISTPLNFNVFSKFSPDFVPSSYIKSIDFRIVISNRAHLKWCSYISVLLLLLIAALTRLIYFFPHKHNRHETPNNCTVAVNHVLKFLDAEKCGDPPKLKMQMTFCFFFSK